MKRITGIDILNKRVLRARSRYPGIEFLAGEIAHLPFADKEFEIVTCIEVLEHQINPVEALKELGRVSSKYVIVTVPDRENLHVTLCPYCSKQFPTDGHLHSFSTEKMLELGKQTNLIADIIKAYYVPVKIRPEWLGKLLRAVQRNFFPEPGNFLAARYKVPG